MPYNMTCLDWYEQIKIYKKIQSGCCFQAYDHFMMTSSNGNILRVTGHLCGEFSGPGEFPAQRPVTRSFDVFFDLVWINEWVNNREAGDLRRYRANYDVTVMYGAYLIAMLWDMLDY